MPELLPPNQDEIEVSLFGPGYGECVLVHMGDQEWLIVDSCIGNDKTPAALDYLRRIGTDPAEAVRLVVATHWHDDHIRGLGALFRACQAAHFSCSDALKLEEFLSLVRLMKERTMLEGSGVEEFNEVLDLLEERKKRGMRVGTPVWAVADRTIWNEPGRRIPCSVLALSPSDETITKSRVYLSGLFPQRRTGKNRVAVRDPNELAVVLSVKVADYSILLGSDLPETSDPGTGWSVIVESHGTGGEKASVFKIPHHGSQNADNPEVWREMLIESPFAILTPFVKGRTKLPKETDAERICQRTDKAYITARPQDREIKGRPREVERTIKETVIKIREVPSATGQVRLRKDLGSSSVDEWTVGLFGTATPLQTIRA